MDLSGWSRWNEDLGFGLVGFIGEASVFSRGSIVLAGGKILSPSPEARLVQGHNVEELELSGELKKQPTIELYTDGACSGNPGPGGWAYVMRDPSTGREKEASGGNPSTTNNQMELLAVIQGLEALRRPCHVLLYSDSQYVGNGLKSWMSGWKANGWRRREGKSFKELKNAELWQRLDALTGVHRVEFHHVRGHSGHEENERCDTLAVAAYQQYL